VAIPVPDNKLDRFTNEHFYAKQYYLAFVRDQRLAPRTDGYPNAELFFRQILPVVLP